MPQIFISYRREDAQSSAGRIYDKLVETFGHDEIFMDVDSITYGDDFALAIEQAVSECKVLIAIIGHEWCKISDANGHRRLDNPDDFVRIEIRAALKRNIRVIPVLVENAQLPSQRELPDDLKPLLQRNAMQINHASFHSDIERLINALEKGPRRKTIVIASLSILALAIIGYFIFFFKGPNNVNNKPFLVKLRVVSADQPTQSFDSGSIVLYLGNESKTSEVHNGEATFFNIPAHLANNPAKIELAIPGFQRTDSGGINLSRQEDFVEVHLTRTTQSLQTTVRGTVINQKNRPVPNALVNISSGLATAQTDDNGDFLLTVPLPAGERTRMRVTVNNITRFNEDIVISSATPINVKIDLTP